MLKDLERRGHQVKLVLINGGCQAIRVDPKTGMLHGGSEACQDGGAAGIKFSWRKPNDRV